MLNYKLKTPQTWTFGEEPKNILLKLRGIKIGIQYLLFLLTGILTSPYSQAEIWNALPFVHILRKCLNVSLN